MSGRRYLLDTNAIIQLLKGNRELSGILSMADFVATSVVCELEFLSFDKLPEQDVALFSNFKSHIVVYGIPADDPSFVNMTVNVRTRFKLKLPDAIIAATARLNGLTTLTADDHFKHLEEPWNVRFFTPI